MAWAFTFQKPFKTSYMHLLQATKEVRRLGMQLPRYEFSNLCADCTAHTGDESYSTIYTATIFLNGEDRIHATGKNLEDMFKRLKLEIEIRMVGDHKEDIKIGGTL